MEQKSTPRSTRHGEIPSPELPPEGHPDPHIYMVFADMDTFIAQDNCECPGVCKCDWHEARMEGYLEGEDG